MAGRKKAVTGTATENQMRTRPRGEKILGERQSRPIDETAGKIYREIQRRRNDQPAS